MGNTGAARNTVLALRVLLKILPRVLLNLFISVRSFLRPKGGSVSQFDEMRRWDCGRSDSRLTIQEPWVQSKRGSAYSRNDP